MYIDRSQGEWGRIDPGLEYILGPGWSQHYCSVHAILAEAYVGLCAIFPRRMGHEKEWAGKGDGVQILSSGRGHSRK